ncbi:hypothetical protein [Paragemmobacter ruber]|uniref:Uncharacterized protein n=1 Tax=Paragemmobacter ruber TaxID=1985673 RepID=A0ABW9Y7L1_9RHOB|nr:hypothetical protein [Rhodobacter ruber]NBE08567.1 hypothetical protein [Rhodobacter ruber]
MSPHSNFDPKTEFAARLARIEAGGINTNRTLFVGMEEMLHLPPGTFVRKRRRRGRAVTVFLGLIAGSLAVAGATMSSAGFY